MPSQVFIMIMDGISTRILTYLLWSMVLSFNALCIGGRGPLEGSGQDSLKNEKPYYIDRIGIDEKLGEFVNLDRVFTDSKGDEKTLANIVGDKPTILLLIYYECPTLCSTHLSSVVQSLSSFDMKAGDDYNLVAVSIDPDEGKVESSKKKKELLEANSLKDDGFYFLTGQKKDIDALANEVGFKFAWDQNMKQWAHTSASYILTPKGKISFYHYGIGLQHKTLRLSLIDAADGKIGTIMERLVLYCLQYDPDKKTYAFYAYNVMKVAALITALILFLFMGKFWLGQMRQIKK